MRWADTIHLDARARAEGDARLVFGQAGAPMNADGVVREERVDAVVGHEPHLLEAVVQVRGELADSEIDEVLRTEGRDDVDLGVLDLRLAAAVRPFRRR